MPSKVAPARPAAAQPQPQVDKESADLDQVDDLVALVAALNSPGRTVYVDSRQDRAA